MGKKVKKETESPPKDVFDPLMIESKTPATVVLMLSSPENEVLAKACDALYKFASKGDENKVTLLGLGALEHLYKLLSHEDPLVRRNAVMVVGIMASNNDVRKLLRELDVTNSLISQLAPEEDVVIHEFATLCLAYMAVEYTTKDFQNRAAVRELNVIPPLLGLLESEYPVIQSLALQTLEELNDLHVETLAVLGNCLEDVHTLQQIQLTGGIQKLLSFLKVSTVPDIQKNAAKAITNAAYDCIVVAKAEGIAPLIKTLNAQRDGAISNAIAVLTNLALQEPIRASIQSQGIMSALVGPLRSTNSQVQSKAAFAVAAFACDAGARAELRNVGGLGPLVELLHSNYEEVRRNACWAVMVCGSDEVTAFELCRLGALDILEEINLSSKRKNKFSEAALETLLDNNLSQKYSRMGYLSPSNIITNGFYDCGQVKHGGKFLSLEELSKQELTDRRAIIFINAKPQESVVEVPEVSPPVSGRSSKEKPRKGRGKKEEEKPKVIQVAPTILEEIKLENSHWVPPPDYVLMDYINDASKTILPITSTREQVVALAQFVAERMGGPVEKEELHNFCWELDMSEIEFDLKSNIVPIGKIKRGTFYHRALLFKVIADRIGIGCSLVRGKYNRCWNEVKLVEYTPKGLLLPPQEYVVDVMFEPGLLFKQGSAKADQYKRI
ncbi:hypothetical protein EK904_005780 [Melospiza melodia maxima]|nr:hypothetical protein EK904_005780 [Melospiza melodia maxima]